MTSLHFCPGLTFTLRSGMSKQVVNLSRVVIRFAGDSGDGMQLTGDRFTSETAGLGNDTWMIN